MKKGKKILKIIISMISGCLFLFSILVLVTYISANKQGKLPMIFNCTISSVPTESMKPTLIPGDYIFLQKVKYENIEVDDIIVYKSKKSNIFIIHRVVSITEEGLVMQGDNNLKVDDEVVTKDMVQGKYCKTLFNLSNISILDNKNLMFGVLFLLFGVIIVTQIFGVYAQMKNEKNKQEVEKLKQEVLEEMKKEILAEELEKLKKDKKTF